VSDVIGAYALSSPITRLCDILGGPRSSEPPWGSGGTVPPRCRPEAIAWHLTDGGVDRALGHGGARVMIL
jgi:hypothetical protein